MSGHSDRAIRPRGRHFARPGVGVRPPGPGRRPSRCAGSLRRPCRRRAAGDGRAGPGGRCVRRSGPPWRRLPRPYRCFHRRRAPCRWCCRHGSLPRARRWKGNRGDRRCIRFGIARSWLWNLLGLSRHANGAVFPFSILGNTEVIHEGHEEEKERVSTELTENTEKIRFFRKFRGHSFFFFFVSFVDRQSRKRAQKTRKRRIVVQENTKKNTRILFFVFFRTFRGPYLASRLSPQRL
ncbi:MAG: hypothetical protein BECKG1743F_GA0114225_102422 [Candidatus Kentron sp. G]|nr:MAG: hypothetical protein BECKG1743F_GA0114225_102422 [Candidatus Kentron sp. G]